MRVNVKKGDLLPKVTARLLDGNGAPVNLTGCTVVFRLFAGIGGTPIWSHVATILDAAQARVEYAWAAGDTDTPGLFFADFRATDSMARSQSFPNDGYFEVEITP